MRCVDIIRMNFYREKIEKERERERECARERRGFERKGERKFTKREISSPGGDNNKSESSRRGCWLGEGGDNVYRKEGFLLLSS